MCVHVCLTEDTVSLRALFDVFFPFFFYRVKPFLVSAARKIFAGLPLRQIWLSAVSVVMFFPPVLRRTLIHVFAF